MLFIAGDLAHNDRHVFDSQFFARPDSLMPADDDAVLIDDHRLDDAVVLRITRKAYFVPFQNVIPINFISYYYHCIGTDLALLFFRKIIRTNYTES